VKRASLGVLLAATIVAFAFPAIAGLTSQQDPNDTAGRLDVRVVRLDGDERPRWKVVTFGRWTLRQLWDRGDVIVQLDTRGDAAVDYLGIVRSNGRELLGTLFRVRRDGRLVRIGKIRPEKDGLRAASVWIALHKLSIGPNRTSYFWSVLTTFTSSRCPRTCFDAVPDEGMLEEPLPGTSPTPTPTPSPTAGPSG
jgi:hypothetical protein